MANDLVVSPLSPASLLAFQERFLDKIQFEPTTGCWLWVGARDKDGYGIIELPPVLRRRAYAAHRMAWPLFREKNAPPLLDHYICDTPPCVNPYHTCSSTSRDNTLRSPISLAGLNARKTRCLKGHPFDYVKNGQRRCRQCDRAYDAAYKRAQRRRLRDA